jgi:hypothetical protein
MQACLGKRAKATGDSPSTTDASQRHMTTLHNQLLEGAGEAG